MTSSAKNPSPPRLALVTGASRGLGASIANALIGRGIKVLTPTREELDLASSRSIDAYIKNHGTQPVDILVNNAGINTLRSITEIDSDTWHAMLQINLSSALCLTQAFAPGMGTRGWGRILNLSTIFSVVNKERRAAYSMTKAGLNALTRSSAIEFGPSGVLVNALAPGFVDTALTRQNNSPEALTAIADTVPLRRLAQPIEIARLAAFLVSEENTYLTGQTIVADGGFTCQ